MALTEQERRQAVSDSKMGNFMAGSGNARVRKLGEIMNKRGADRIDESNKYRAPVSLGRGILVNPDGSVTNSDAYDKSLGLEHKRKMEAQAAEDAEALLRAQTMAQIKRDNPNITSSERKTMVDTENVITEASGLLDNWVSGSVNPTVDMFASVFDDSMLAPFKTVIEGRFYTPAQQSQRVAAAQMEAKISVALAGKNLTGFELEERRRWSPFTAGISDAESKRRLKELRDVFTRSLGTQQRSLNIKPAVTETPQVVQEQPRLGVTPVGQPRPLSDGTVWQKYSDGSTQQVQ